ncbi:MAG: peptide-N-glycosidase F-related protein [Chitinophagales bacterium]
MKYTVLAVLFTFFAISAIAGNGDTIHVISHNKQLIQTDPGIGHTEYAHWAQFPPASVNYRKAKVIMTFGCPPGMHCGEWDYLNYVWLRRKGSVNSAPLNYQLVKFITPYGYNNPSSWKFTWEMDVTDFSSLLHDSVEIEYQHTGYEATSGRGWLVTLDFELTEGVPTYQPISIDTLWHGSFNFGNAAHDLETYLAPRNITISSASDAQRFFLIQTGHGSDTLDGCCEFANYNQNFYIDNSLNETWQLWRRCGDNPCYPQSGTWPLDRGNWCPGSTVAPYIKPMKLSSGNHTIDLEMQDKVHSLFQQGNYDLAAYLFQYKDNRFNIDATLEKILQPSSDYEQLRINPISCRPKIILKNSGKQLLNSVIIRYGYEGYYDTDYKWQGNLGPDQSTEVTLPNMVINHTPVGNIFYAYTIAPNGQCDQYPYDDTLRTAIKTPAVYDSVIVLNFKTPNDLPSWNASSADFSYQLKDASGNVLYQRNAGTLAPSTVYRDTFHLEEGVYDLFFRNENPEVSYGVGFWLMANYGQTAGYVKLDRKNGTNVKNLGADWGAFIHEAIVVGAPEGTPVQLPSACNAAGIVEAANRSGLLIWPNPASDKVQVCLTGTALPASFILCDISGKELVREEALNSNGSATAPFDVSKLAAGIYLVKAEAGSNWFTKKLVVIHP